MNTFVPDSDKVLKNATHFFSMRCREVDLEKYSDKEYCNLLDESIIEAMYDSDLAYYNVYAKCADNSSSKDQLLNYLKIEEQFVPNHPNAFNNEAYRLNTVKAVSEIKHHLNNGDLDYLFY